MVLNIINYQVMKKQLYDSKNIKTNDPSSLSNAEKTIPKPKKLKKSSEKTFLFKNETHLIVSILKIKVGKKLIKYDW